MQPWFKDFLCFTFACNLLFTQLIQVIEWSYFLDNKVFRVQDSLALELRAKINNLYFIERQNRIELKFYIETF